MDSAALARVGAQFEGLLLEQILAPLIKPLGEGAVLALGPLAQSLAARESGGFAAVLTAALKSHDTQL
ncbi:MAG: hypothetical protein NVS1B14_10810 [Vulcanimicrobiaceae bacterium]